MLKPIKRQKSLQSISREHHHGLLFSWKLRQGIKLGITPERILKYVNWFWVNQLKDHFEFEESYIFPILGSQHQLIKRALSEHQKLKQLFSTLENTYQHLSKIEANVVLHIRFEERVLFQEVENIATKKQLETIETLHSNPAVETWEDEFWISN